MTKLFVDTNVVLDLLGKRAAYLPAARLFTLGDRGEVALYVSVLSFANINNILTRQQDRSMAIKALRKLELIVQVVDLTAKITKRALDDEDFTDFEDGLQYYSAVESGTEAVITRNHKDFTHSKLPVMSAEEYLSSLG
ncbi:hypothetical protein LEM8419_02615 [Neolewinella maritima]|uniref:PIN domain-containing protein n=1 Tax=Neolewinella maritima TaxID=1383882 RepID=A0ABM9B3K6_9BACT|nr:PIN domain-containing protein [Neolewinella maritima]CAH1001709.1 hypothetical protein LEM8419_02615 [Neolewinella maritima]